MKRRITNLWSRRILAMFMVMAMIVGNSFGSVGLVEAAGGTGYGECVTGSAGGTTCFTDHDNWGGPDAEGVIDGDLDVPITNANPKHPVEFKFNVTNLPQTSAYMLIRGYDVDEEDGDYSSNSSSDGEWDRVYLSDKPEDIKVDAKYAYTNWLTNRDWNNLSDSYKREMNHGAYVGALSGENETWNTTVLPIAIDRIVPGDNYVGVTIHHYYKDPSSPNTGWQMTLDWGQLVIDGGSKETGEITNAQLKSGTGANAGDLIVNTDFLPKQDGDFAVEVNLIEKVNIDGDEVDQNLAVGQQRYVSKKGNVAEKSEIILKNVTLDPSHEYTLNVILYNDGGATTEDNGKRIDIDPQEVQHVYTMSTFDPKVSDIVLDDLPQYGPTSFNQEYFEDKFSKINGQQDNTLGKVKIVTVPDPTAGKLVFEGESGPVNVTEGYEIPAAKLGNLKFVPNPSGGFNKEVTFKWNGYDDAKDKYAQFDANVSIIPNLAPTLDEIVIPANKGTGSITDLGSRIKNAVHSDDTLENITITTLPSMGHLEYSPAAGEPITVGADNNVIPWAVLDTLKYIPGSEEQTGSVSFTWNGSDGVQPSKAHAMVTIRINTPPVAQGIAQPGLEGKPVIIPASAFKITDADGDVLDSIQFVTVPDPSVGTLSYNTTVNEAVYTPVQAEDYIKWTELKNVVFTPVPNLPLTPPVVMGWKANDGKQNSENEAAITITYDGRPIAIPQTVEAEEGDVAVPILLSGTDPEDSELEYSITAEPALGTLQSAGPGNHWLYIPAEGVKWGTDTFGFSVTDSVYSQTSIPALVTIVMNRTLDGWVGEQNQGDNQVVIGIPGKPLEISAVSSLKATQVNATVNGVRIPLTETDPSGAAARGFKTWSKNDCSLTLLMAAGYCVLPIDTAPGTYTVTFEALNGSGSVLPAETKLQDNSFKVVGTNLELKANPSRIPGDGKSTTELTAVLKDGNGNPVEGVTVNFEAPAGQGGFTNSDTGTTTGVTDAQGKVTVTYQSPVITGVNEQEISVTVTVDDPVKGVFGEEDLILTFQPATIQGILTKGDTNNPVPNATIRVTLDSNNDGVLEFDETVVTDTTGAYSLSVPKANAVYDLEVTQTVMVGGVATPVSYKQKAKVGDVAGTGDEVVDSERTVSGLVLFKTSDGETSLLNSAMIGQMKVYLKDASDRYILDGAGKPKPFALGSQGVFSADGLAVGKYNLEVRYEIEAGKEITITRGTVNVKLNGEMNISQELVDPYGVITDAVTGAVIKDATVTLYYADTPDNRANGITPGTKVTTLPLIPGFEPNNNANPEQKSDENGFYAYMVFPNTDYYLTVTKDGYNSYRSPTIEVDLEIVKHDVKLHRESSPNGGSVNIPAQPNVSLNLSVDKNLVEEGTQSTVTVGYKNESSAMLPSGEIRVTLPEEVEIIDAGEGTVNGNMITWSIKNMAGYQTGELKVVVKWAQLAQKDASFEIKGQFTAGGSTGNSAAAQAAAKMQVFSKRFGNLSHQRYILGYPDGQFKPEKPLNRAELAAIVARLTENNDLADTLNYTDVPSDDWAANYIKIVTKHGYFKGFDDGTFRPMAPVTRGELAAVMVRFLELSPSKSGELHFTDVQGHWAADAIEELYRVKFLSGYPDGTFKPQNNINRSEAVTMINRMLYRGPLQGLNAIFPDVPVSHWAFGDVQEATVSHEADRNSDGSETWVQNIADDVK